MARISVKRGLSRVSDGTAMSLVKRPVILGAVQRLMTLAERSTVLSFPLLNLGELAHPAVLLELETVVLLCDRTLVVADIDYVCRTVMCSSLHDTVVRFQNITT